MIKHLFHKYITANVATTAPPPSGACDGVPTTDWSCCSTSSPCNVGGGDCDRDSHCTVGLTCGSNNCLADFSTSGSSWSSGADCCEGMSRKGFKILNVKISNIVRGNILYLDYMSTARTTKNIHQAHLMKIVQMFTIKYILFSTCNHHLGTSTFRIV